MGAEEEQTKQRNETLRPDRITPAQFLSWKRQKDSEAAARKAEVARKRLEDIASGLVPINGHELFLHEPSVFDNNLY